MKKNETIQWSEDKSKITFEADLIREGSWGEQDIGHHTCTMELYHIKDAMERPVAGLYQIEWVASEGDPYNEEVEHIGIWTDGAFNLIDYDGIFSLPTEAIELLEANGIKVGDDYKEV